MGESRDHVCLPACVLDSKDLGRRKLVQCNVAFFQRQIHLRLHNFHILLFHTSFRVWSQYHRFASHYFLAGRRHCSALSRVGPAAQYKPYVVVAEEYNGSSSANSESIGWEWSNKTRTSILCVQISVQISVFLFLYPFLEDQRSWAGAKVMKLAAHCRRCTLHACMQLIPMTRSATASNGKTQQKKHSSIILGLILKQLPKIPPAVLIPSCVPPALEKLFKLQ